MPGKPKYLAGRKEKGNSGQNQAVSSLVSGILETVPVFSSTFTPLYLISLVA